MLAAILLVGCQTASFDHSAAGSSVTPPVASFAETPSTPTAGQSVQFTDTTSGNPTAWSWNFGDGSTSTVQNPTHTYTAAGPFTVSLTASNSSGSNAASHALTVLAAFAAAFTATPAAPVSAQSVAFTDATTGSPTAWSWSFGDGSTSALENPNHIYATAGTFTASLTATGAEGTSTASQKIVVAPEVSASGYDMTLTLSDGAQSTTLAFDGFAMMTGNLDAQSFFPPGKVADYTGFQYLRDTDPDNMGHNTDFLTRVANNVIYTLTDAQMAALVKLASAQLENVNFYAYERFSLMEAFRRTLTGNIPSGSTGLNLDSVKKASHDLYLIDGQLAFDRAMLYVSVYNSMTPDQIDYLEAMKGKGFNEWPNITDAQIASKMSNLPQGTATLVMTYASDIFTWYEGSLYADVYFCPERHGTYYGGFYIKDAPAVGESSYTISEQLTATTGSALIDSSLGYVTSSQASVLSALVNAQRNSLYAGDTNIVSIRTQIATLLRSLMVSTSSSAAVNSQILALSGTYGELDGEDNYNYATVFAQVNGTLSASQQAQLATLRKSVLSGTYADGTPFDFTTATTPFLYADVITDTSVLTPYVGDTDYLFVEP